MNREYKLTIIFLVFSILYFGAITIDFLKSMDEEDKDKT